MTSTNISDKTVDENILIRNLCHEVLSVKRDEISTVCFTLFYDVNSKSTYHVLRQESMSQGTPHLICPLPEAETSTKL